MQPVKEYGGDAYTEKLYGPGGSNPDRARQMGNVNPGDGARYCGRGYVQLTWRNNYKKAGMALGIPLETDPDLALQPRVAAAIIVRGMSEGWFTGKKLGDFLGNLSLATPEQFAEARRIVNGSDKADLIAGHAVVFQRALEAGKW